MSDDLVAHLETYLGPIRGGWTEDGRGVPLPVPVVWFADAPEPGVVTLATLGLSRHRLPSGQKDVRLELVLSVESRFRSDRLLGALTAVGEEVVARHRPLLRGDVVPMGDGLVAGSPLDTFYIAPPVMLPDAFAVLGATEPPTVFAWMVPITSVEAGLVESRGWRWFEDLLVQQQPNLFDLERGPIEH